MIRAVFALLFILLLQTLVLLAPAIPVIAQQNGCRTSPLTSPAISAYCASEAFVSRHFPSTSTAGHLVTFADSSGQVLADGGAPTGGITIGSTTISGGTSNCTLYDAAGAAGCTLGVLLNTTKAISGSYPIAAGDAALTLIWTGSPGTITLPAVTGFDPSASVRICNNNANDNSHHAATLSGFPAGANAHLWMGQCMEVSIESGAWQVTSSPGRFVPNFTFKCFVDTGGSNNNSGLVSNASTSAVHDPQQCLNVWQNEIDLGSQQPSIALTCNQINNQDGGAGPFLYALRPTRVIFFVNNGACGGNNPILRNTSGSVVAELSDFGGYVIFDGVTLDCTNAASHPCFDLFIHQQNGTDLSTAGFTTGVTFIGASASDVGLWCDSMCKTNTGAVLTFSGTFLNLLQLDFGSMMDLNNGMTLAASTGVTKNIAQLNTGSQIVWSGTLTLGASNSVAQVFEGVNGANIILANSFATAGSAIGGGARQWAILNNGLLCNASPTAIPGSAGINTGTGWAAGIIGAATSGACIP